MEIFGKSPPPDRSSRLHSRTGTASPMTDCPGAMFSTPLNEPFSSRGSCRSSTSGRLHRTGGFPAVPKYVVITRPDRRVVQGLVNRVGVVEDRVAKLLCNAQTRRGVVQIGSTDPQRPACLARNLNVPTAAAKAIPAGATPIASAPPAAKPPITVRARRDRPDICRCFAI